MIKIKELDKFFFDYINYWAEVLSSVAWEIRASYHSTLNATPAQLVFGRDMLFNIKKVINWKLITENKRKQIACNNKRKNTGAIKNTYKQEDEFLGLKLEKKRKYSNNKSNP